ncbi:MAG: hypothetical protein PHV93_02425 [Candidatus Pacebacteria bacterium]|nr:hypothetical protein [Candidatus Paceibacterota bacterium]
MIFRKISIRKSLPLFFVLFFLVFSVIFPKSAQAGAVLNKIAGLSAKDAKNGGHALTDFINSQSAENLSKALNAQDLYELGKIHSYLSPEQLQLIETKVGGEGNLSSTLGDFSSGPARYSDQGIQKDGVHDTGVDGSAEQRVNALLTGDPSKSATPPPSTTPPDTAPPTTPPDTTPSGATTPPVTTPPTRTPGGAASTGVKGGPFGGAILVPPIRCDNQMLLLKLGPPTPGFYMWPPTAPPYWYNPPKTVGQWLLGMASLAPVPCTKGHTIIGKGFLILYNGASLAGGKTSGKSSSVSSCSGGSCSSCSGGSCSLSGGSGTFGQSLGSPSSFGNLQAMLVNLAGGVLGNVLAKLRK